MQLQSYLTRKNIYIFGLVLLAVGMPLSRFLVSVSQFVLLANWITDLNYREKWSSLRSAKAFWAYIALYLFFVLGLLWTDDFAYGLKDLRIKLPMLWLPVLFFSSPKLERKEYHAILHFFVGGVLVASCWSMLVYSGLTGIEIHDIRDISRFESHIRFSLMIVLAILYLLFVMMQKSTRFKGLYLLALLWLTAFLFFLQSFTGILIGGLIGFTALSWMLVSKNAAWVKIVFTVAVLSMVSYVIYVVYDEWGKFKPVPMVDKKTMPLVTQSNRDYFHDYTLYFSENGNLVWMYVQDDEMRQEWNKRSSQPYDSLDRKGNKQRFTLVRYLASKGLTRDSVGMSKMTEADIRNVEKGYPNYLYTSRIGLRTRVHEILWEIEQARLGEEPSGHSLAMRVEFWKTAWHIIQKQPAFGVGTGDVEQAFKQQYRADRSSLPEKWQLRSHNQFLAVTVALGFAGLFVFLVHLFSPFLFRRRHSHFFVLFMLVQFLSFFNEDTLETQAGVTFCVFFTQFLFHHDEYNL